MRAYQPEYAGRWIVLIGILVATTLQVCQSPLVKYLEATGRMWPLFIMNIGYSSVLLLATNFLVRYGASGIAWANVPAFIALGMWLGVYMVIIMRRDMAQGVKSKAPPVRKLLVAASAIGLSPTLQKDE
jgi:energy-converting hydrogenase Eha subunit E